MLVFHSKTDNRVTIVGEYCDEGLCLTAARCSDKDNFCRKIGRELATRRFNVKRHCITVNVGDRTIKGFVDVAKKVAEFVSKDIKFKQNLGSYDLLSSTT